MTTTVWVVTQEAEVGSFADGSTYCLEGAFTSAKVAEEYIEEQRALHDWPGEDDEEVSDWCTCCDPAVCFVKTELSLEAEA